MAKDKVKVRANNQEYYYSHRSEILEHHQQYRKSNQEKLLEYYQDYNESHRKERIDYAQKRRKEHPEKVAEIDKQVVEKLHLSVLARLGGKCRDCACDVPKYLHVHHFNQSWKRGNRPESEHSANLWRKIRKMEHPEKEYCILCLAHNIAEYQDRLHFARQKGGE